MTTESQLRAHFERLRDAWLGHLEATAHVSFPYAAIDCDAFAELAAMGELILPLVLAEYARHDRDTPWAALLARLRPDVGLGDGLVGDVAGARAAWLTWGRREGLLATVKG